MSDGTGLGSGGGGVTASRVDSCLGAKGSIGGGVGRDCPGETLAGGCDTGPVGGVARPSGITAGPGFWRATGGNCPCC